jgi:hypothetical protein
LFGFLMCVKKECEKAQVCCCLISMFIQFFFLTSILLPKTERESCLYSAFRKTTLRVNWILIARGSTLK